MSSAMELISLYVLTEPLEDDVPPPPPPPAPPPPPPPPDAEDDVVDEDVDEDEEVSLVLIGIKPFGKSSLEGVTLKPLLP
jgi:hypothetical protein